ncbi:MAG: signal peptidase I [Clostridia bacterium]|nr:signal peptidase I [Clostridia bacterium]
MSIKNFENENNESLLDKVLPEDEFFGVEANSDSKDLPHTDLENPPIEDSEASSLAVSENLSLEDSENSSISDSDNGDATGEAQPTENELPQETKEAYAHSSGDQAINDGKDDDAQIKPEGDITVEEANSDGAEARFEDTVFITEIEADSETEEGSDDAESEKSDNGSDSAVENVSDAEAEAESEAANTSEEEADGQFPTVTFENDEAEEADEPEVYTKRVYNPDKPRGIDTVFDFLELFIFSLAAVLVITTFFFRHSVVEGSSMENTLYEGEHIIISDLFYTPDRGDIIVCEDYTTALRKPIVKRVIGIEGDRVQVTEDGRVTVNGVELDESDYVFVDFGANIDKDAVDVIVPEGEVFVMGDHRNMSTDSRDIGTVKVDSILGKVILRFYPFDKFGRVE